MARQMQSLFTSKCARCGERIAKGAPIFYDRHRPRGSRCWHVQCGDTTPAPQPQPQPQPVPVPVTDGVPAGVHYAKTRSAMGKPMHYVKADSLHALHEWRATVRNEANRYHWNDVTPENRPNGPKGTDGALAWFGASGPETRRILDSGVWPEGVQRMLDTIGKIQSNAQPIDSRRRRRWADQGDSVDMARVWAGRLDVAWQRCTRMTTRAPAPVTLLVNLSQKWSTHSDQLFWRGAAALLLTDALTEAGYNVEIEVWYTGTNVTERGADGAVGVTVKDARSPLDLNALAVSCAFGGFFRCEVFQAVCALPDVVDGGLGQPEAFRDVVPESVDPRAPIICEGITNAETAREWITQALARIEAPQQEAA